MKIVVLDEELPYPANSGKRIRTLNLITRLAHRQQITYLCHRNQDPDEAREAERYLRDHGIEVIVVDRAVPPKSGLAFYGRLASNLLSPLPYSVQTHTSTALQNAVGRQNANGNVDVWHVEWTPYAQSLAGVVHSPCVIMAHNIESQIWERFHETETNPAARWYIRGQWKKFELFERRILAWADRAVAVSDSDAGLIRRRFGREEVDVVENGVDLDFFRSGSRKVESPTLLFLGSLDWRPNLDAVRWLLDDAFPRLLAVRPYARLAIVGRKPPSWLAERVRRQRNAELHADVPDVRPHLAGAAAMVIPLRIGGGTRLKILEAAAAGVPVVSTAIGAEGLSLVPGEHYLQADSPAQMASALVRVLDDPLSAARMADRAHQHVSARYGWQARAEKLERIWLACGRGKNDRGSACERLIKGAT